MADFNFGVFDYLQIDLPDEDYTFAQVEANREDENLNTLFKFPDQADNYGLTIGDFDSTPSASFGYVKTYTSLTAGLSLSDNLYVKHTVETLGILLALSRTDTLYPRIDGESTIAVSLSRSDEILPRLIASIDAMAISLARTDELLPEIVETPITVLSTLLRTDILYPYLTDVSALLARFSVSDELKPLIDASLIILSSLTRTDELLPKIDETISSAGTMTVDDELLPRIDSAMQILVSLLRTDILYLTVDETNTILTQLGVSDELKPYFVELAEILWLTLEAFRFRDDDGTEITASWLGSQDANINRTTELNTRLRVLLDTNSDAPGLQLKLQYRPVGDPDWEWRDIS